MSLKLISNCLLFINTWTAAIASAFWLWSLAYRGYRITIDKATMTGIAIHKGTKKEYFINVLGGTLHEIELVRTTVDGEGSDSLS